MGLDPQITLIEGDEHHELRDPMRREIMEPQLEVAEEPSHKWVRRNPELGKVEGDEGDDLRFSERRLCCFWVQQIPPEGWEDQPCLGHLQHFTLGPRRVPLDHCERMKMETSELRCEAEGGT